MTLKRRGVSVGQSNSSSDLLSDVLKQTQAALDFIKIEPNENDDTFSHKSSQSVTSIGEIFGDDNSPVNGDPMLSVSSTADLRNARLQQVSSNVMDVTSDAL